MRLAGLHSLGDDVFGTTHSQPAKKRSESDSLKLAIARLREKGLPITDLQERLDGLSSRGLPCLEEPGCRDLWTEIGKESGQHQILSHLTVNTKKPKATIRYQTLADRFMHGSDIRTMKRPTKCTDRIAIGSYYIWAVRNDVPTSSVDNRFDIVGKTENVELAEQ